MSEVPVWSVSPGLGTSNLLLWFQISSVALSYIPCAWLTSTFFNSSFIIGHFQKTHMPRLLRDVLVTKKRLCDSSPPRALHVCMLKGVNNRCVVWSVIPRLIMGLCDHHLTPRKTQIRFGVSTSTFCPERWLLWRLINKLYLVANLTTSLPLRLFNFSHATCLAFRYPMIKVSKEVCHCQLLTHIAWVNSRTYICPYFSYLLAQRQQFHLPQVFYLFPLNLHSISGECLRPSLTPTATIDLGVLFNSRW